MAAAEQQANTGEVVVGEEVVMRLGKEVVVAHWLNDRTAETRFACISGLTTPVAETPWPMLDSATLSTNHLRAWLLPTVYE